MAKKTKARKQRVRVTAKSETGPIAATGGLESERRWRRLVAREPDALAEAAGTDAPTDRPGEAPQGAQQPQGAGPGTGSRVDVAGRPPLRLETGDQERARYPERLARWEAARSTVESRRGREDEDREHRTTCGARRCDDPAHVMPRREWREATKHDLRHLGSCAAESAESCPDRDRSHLLPPQPLEVADEYCCQLGCYPRTDPRSLTECVSVPAPVRLRRQRELERLGKGAFGVAGGGFAGAAVVTSTPLSESTVWAWRGRRVYDPASAPLRA